MEPCISERLIERTWKRVGASSSKDVTKLQKRHLKLQKPLVTFISAHVESLREDAAGVFLYVAHVILEAALNCTPKPRKITATDIQKARDDLNAGNGGDAEIYLTQYASEAFSEDDDVTLGVNEIELMMTSIQLVNLCIHRSLHGTAHDA